METHNICVYAICRNEERFVDRWMDAVDEADLVVVTDTGSTDNTVARLRERGAMVYEERIDPWRFDTARNVAMDHVPETMEICVSNDLDEVFEPGWRTRLEKAWQPEHTRAGYWFAWSHRADGEVEKRFPMEKIHRRHGFRWVHPVHEILQYSGDLPDKAVFIDDLVLHHHPDPDKSRSQYLPLLELALRENPQDDRTAFWLGREYVFQRRYDDAIRTLRAHLEMEGARWDEERSASMRFIARAYREKGDDREAEVWLHRAVAECPHVREPFLDLARLGYDRRDWPLVFFAADRGLRVPSPTNSYLVEPASWGYALHDLAAIACYRLGMYTRSLEHARRALDLAPGDERLQTNLRRIARACGCAGEEPGGVRQGG